MATTLIVARPLVLGEDPGLSADMADPWGMVLTLLWLLAATGWAGWRYWLRSDAESSHDGERAETQPNPHHWYGGLVQTALLATVALVFVSAQFAASYKFPGRLVAWEWFGLFVSFFVVRQLAVTPAEQHGLFAVVLAGAAALSIQGIYQKFVELPQNRKLAENPEEFRAKWAEENPGQVLSESFLQQLRQRARENNIFGPYAHPNSYAGFLVLGLPGLIGAVAVSRRMRAAYWQVLLTALCAVVGLAALWVTHSRGAILGLAAAGVGAGLFLYGRNLRNHLAAVLVGFVILVGVVYVGGRSGLLTTGMGKSGNTIAQRLEYWRTTWRMIQERPCLGVGPGNFGENYTRFMPETSEEKIKDPHNFALEMWATCGIFALMTLGAALAAFFLQMIGWLGGWVVEEAPTPLPNHPTTQPPNHPTTQPPEIRWEFYLGGMFGLLLGFVLRVNTATPGNIMAETYAAAIRSVAWFAAFALLERLDWTERGRVLALTTGIAALLFNLCVSGGIGFPSVANPMWIAIALALNAAALRPTSWLSRAGATRIFPLPVFLGIFLGYGVYILYPILSADDLVRAAAKAVAFLQSEKIKPQAEQDARVRGNPISFLRNNVIGRLEQAARLTPDDARIYVQLAWGTHQLWEARRPHTRQELPIAEDAVRYAARAIQLDPHGAEGYLVLYRIRMSYAEINQASAEALRKDHGDPLLINDREHTAREQFRMGAETLEKFLLNDPYDTELHYALWLAWHKAGVEAKAQEHARRALQLNDLIHVPARRLTESQRKELEAAQKDSSK